MTPEEFIKAYPLACSPGREEGMRYPTMYDWWWNTERVDWILWVYFRFHNLPLISCVVYEHMANYCHTLLCQSRHLPSGLSWDDPAYQDILPATEFYHSVLDWWRGDFEEFVDWTVEFSLREDTAELICAELRKHIVCPFEEEG